MATWSPVPISDITIGNWVKESDGGTTNLYAEIDEGIGTENTGIKVANSASHYFCNLTAVPGDLGNGSVTALTYRIRVKQSGYVDDDVQFKCAIRDQAGTPQVLAGAASGNYSVTTSPEIIVANVTSTTYVNSGTVTPTYLNTGATAAQWGQAQLQIRSFQVATKGSDSVTFFVDAVELIVTYTPTALLAKNQYFIMQAVPRTAVR